jgi:hypothetical protein
MIATVWSDPVVRAVLITLVVVGIIEWIGAGVQLCVRRWRRTHLPTFPIRSRWERWVGNSLNTLLGQPTAAQRRAARGPAERERLAARSRQAWERFYAEYPTERPARPQKTLSEPLKATSKPELNENAVPTPPRGIRRAQPAPYDVFAFGQPEVEVYHEDDYVEPLRCSPGSRCRGRDLQEGEPFWRVPDRNDPLGDFIVVCTDCGGSPVPRRELI